MESSVRQTLELWKLIKARLRVQGLWDLGDYARKKGKHGSQVHFKMGIWSQGRGSVAKKTEKQKKKTYYRKVPLEWKNWCSFTLFTSAPLLMLAHCEHSEFGVELDLNMEVDTKQRKEDAWNQKADYTHGLT